MKKNLIILLLILFTLTACVASPQRLGFSKAEWESMDKNKQAELLRNYKQMDSANKRLAGEDKDVDKDNKNTAAITVSISGGKVMMPPFIEAYAFEPASFRIQEGSCEQVLLKEKDEGKHQVKMSVCFKKGILLLDPSRYDVAKGDSSAQLYRSSLWRSGFSYSHINSSGYARLQDVTIRITQAPQQS